MGSIPAWAGEPSQCGPSALQRQVYPRVGGGASGSAASGPEYEGLSPRGRGSPPTISPGWRRQGSIPAWAGEPISLLRKLCFLGVYPRVGGGAQQGLVQHQCDYGLSPRGRGSPGAASDGLPRSGSIPAWAGEPWRRRRAAMHQRVYPRVGGGAKRHFAAMRFLRGLSPRGRGSQNNIQVRTPIHRVYPRVGGGARTSSARRWTWLGLSPRGRGSLDRLSDPPISLRSIPAWAGEPG